MQANKGRDTTPELAVRRAAYRLGLRYRVSTRPEPSLRRTADLVFRGRRVAVFIDGCFWHGCPQHHSIAKRNADYWASKVTTNLARDRDTTKQLTAAGWTVLRYWEHEPADDVAADIARVVRAPS